MKKLGLVIGIVAGLLVLLLAVAWFLLDVNKYRGVIQTQLEQQLGRKVILGKMSLGLLPLRFQVATPIIMEDPRFGQAPFLRAENLSVQANLMSLIRGNIKINSVELSRPKVELVRDKQGDWNFSTLGPPSAAAPPSTPAPAPAPGPAPAPAPGAPGKGFALDSLIISDGQVAITDLQQPRAARAVYDHIDLKLLDYAPEQAFSFDLAAHIQGQGQQEVRLAGTGGPVVQAKPADTPLHAKLTITQVGIDSLKKFLDTDMLTNATGSLSGESQIDNKPPNLTAVGKLKIDGPRFNNVDIGYPITLDYNLGTNIEQSLITINNATAQLGPTPVSVAGSVNTAATPPMLDLRLKSGDVSISEIARLASAFGVAFAPGTTVTGQVALDVQAKGSASNPALNGNINGRNLRISGQNVPQPVDIKAVDLALSPTEIRSNEFNATSGKTTVAARFGVRQYTSNSPFIDAGLRAPNASLPEIQSIARAYGVTGLDQINGSGNLNFDLRAAGSLQSLNATAVTRALNGTMNLDFSPLKISGFDTVNELANIGGFSQMVGGKQTFTDILKFTGQILVKNGVAQTNDLRAQLGIGNLAAAGTADLASEILNMKVSTVLSKEFSDKVGSSRVSGYLRTALSNEAGELVIPAIVTGSFKQPKFAPDVQAIAQMQKQRFLPSLKDPAGLLGNVLGGLKSNQAAPDKDGQQPPPTKPTVKGILDGLFGGKKQD